MSASEEPPAAWEDKDVSSVQSERARLVSPPLPAGPSAPAAGSARVAGVNLINLALACFLVGIVTYYSFRDGAKLFSYHPVAMTLGWLVFMPGAINALRPGDVATSWLPVQLRSTRHWILQVVAAALILLGFAVIVSNKIALGKPHFVTLHAVFGLVSVTLAALTITGGVAALYSLKLKKLLPPVYTKLLHGSAGLLTFSLGVATLVLGLCSHAVDSDLAKVAGSLIAVVVAVLTVLRPSVGMYTRLRERLGYVH